MTPQQIKNFVALTHVASQAATLTIETVTKNSGESVADRREIIVAMRCALSELRNGDPAAALSHVLKTPEGHHQSANARKWFTKLADYAKACAAA